MWARLVALILLLLPAASLADIQVVDVYFEDYDRRLIRAQTLPAGDTVYLTFKLAGFKRDDEQRVRMSYTIDCFDPSGKPLVASYSKKIEETLAPQDEKWRPKADWSVVIPGYAPGGEYRVAIVARDEIAGKEVKHEMPFQVMGANVEPSDTLVVRRFEFADTETGPSKPDPPAYPRGSKLWGRFRVTGYRISPEKQVWVEGDLAVVDSEGQVLFERPKAIDEQHQMFYPPRFLLEIFNLDVQEAVKPGDYAIRVTLRDLLGKQETKHESKFTVLP